MEAALNHPDSISESCPFCFDLNAKSFPHQPTTNGEYARLPLVWSSIQRSSLKCLTCSLLNNILRRFFRRTDLSNKAIEMKLHHTLRIQIGSSGRHEDELVLYSTKPTPWSSIKIQDHISGWTDTEESLQFAKDILAMCSKEHALCRTPEDTTLPTRVLDLQSLLEDAEQAEAIKLLETGYQKAPYACLSHCWGKADGIKTLKDNLELFKESIPLDSLPRTFRDAVDFTRRMGIRYLWIDSLCIIQDDFEDWRREAAQMGDIYRHCVVCIAATNSTSLYSGCYAGNPVRTERFESSSFASFSKCATPWEIYVRNSISHRALIDPVTPQPDLESSPGHLRTRGWVFQERMLAPRYLHFLEQELAWECRMGASCECQCQCDVVRMGSKKSEFAQSLASNTPSALAFEWRQMMVSYCSLNFTKESDKLPAIAGIAKLFEEARGSTCHAGIWSDSVEEDLAWQVWNPGGWRHTIFKKHAYARTEGVPTWTWASVSAPLIYDPLPTDRNERLCDFIEIGHPGVIPNAKSDELEPPKLVVNGYLLPATLTYEGDGELCDLKLPGYEKPIQFGNDVSLGVSGLGFIARDEVLFCLALVKCHLVEDRYQYKSLVLQKLDAETNLYRRAGLLRHSDDIFKDISEKSVIDII